MAAPELKEDFEKAEAEAWEKAEMEAEKQAKKKAEDDKWLTQIKHDIRDKTFDTPILMFHHKDDLITFAGGTWNIS